MKRALITILLTLILSITNQFQAQATFPGKNIVFWNLAQSDEQKDKDLVKAYDLATQKDYKQALALIEKKIQRSPKLATLHIMKGLISVSYKHLTLPTKA